jgi:hypothetical protein
MKARSCAIVPTGDGLRLTVNPVRGKRVVIDFDSAAASAIGWKMHKWDPTKVSMLDDMRAERDALTYCIAALEPQAQMEVGDVPA